MSDNLQLLEARIYELLLPLMSTQRDQETILLPVFRNKQVRHQFRWGRSSHEFTQHLIAILSINSLIDLLDQMIDIPHINNDTVLSLQYELKLLPDGDSTTLPKARSSQYDRIRQTSHLLLPWLANRKEQNELLKDHFRKHLQSRNPILFIIHGAEAECHDIFVDQMKSVVLPSIPSFANYALEKVTFHWPKARENMHSLLKQALGIGDQGPIPSLSLLLETHITITDGKELSTKQIREFMQFWHDLSKLRESQLILVCLCISYRRVKQNFFPLWFNRQSNRIEQRIQRAMDEFGEAILHDYDQVLCCILPKLEPVTYEDAHSLAIGNDLKEHFWNKGISRDIVGDIGALYDQNNRNPIPMRDLGNHILKWMNT